MKRFGFEEPKYETLKVDGEISYGEGNGAWNIIRLKRDILKEFPQLREKREKFDYSMIMHRSFEDLRKAIGEMEESKIEGINYGYGTHENPFVKYYPNELQRFFDAEKKHKFTTKLIFSRGHKQKQPRSQIKYIDPEIISEVRTMISGNKVFLVDFKKPFTSIIIENKQIAESYKKHFNVLWKIAKK